MHTGLRAGISRNPHVVEYESVTALVDFQSHTPEKDWHACPRLGEVATLSPYE